MSATPLPRSRPSAARTAAPRALKETLHLLADLPVGVVGFSVVVTGLSTGVGLLITLVGIPLVAATLLLARVAAGAERARARALLGCELAAPEAMARETSLLRRIIAPIRDVPAWRATVYFLAMLPAGIVTFTVAVTWWATSLALLTLPAWAWALPHNGPELWNDGTYWNKPWQLVVSTLAGVLLTLAAPAVIHATTFLDRWLLKLLAKRP